MCDEKWPYADPRVAGIREHLDRVNMFLYLALQATDSAQRFRFLVAGVYFARGVAELMFEAADKEQVQETRDELKKMLSKKLPWFGLIEKIRIHDFHRFGLLAPDPDKKVMFLGGPIKLQAQRGSAAYTVHPSGPQVHATDNSKVQEQRPLLNSDGDFFDDETRKYVSLEKILS